MLNGIVKILSVLELKLNVAAKFFEFKDQKLRKIFSVLIFLAALHILYSYVGIYRHIHERPCSIHSSAQCQRASVAMNYYSMDMNFFKPRILRSIEGDGITGLEFPIVYYSGAIMYKLFGFDETYLRLISLLIISAGLLLFYLLCDSFLKNILLSLCVVASIVVSPVLLYYSANFLPDIPGFGFVLMAWYFFSKYLSTGKTRQLNLFMLCATMGALLKSVCAMSFAVVICLLILDKFRPFKNVNGERLFKDHKQIAIRIGLGIFAVIAWYAYVRLLDGIYHNPSFAMGPMQVKTKESLHRVTRAVKNIWFFQYYTYETYILVSCSIVLLMMMAKKANRLLLAITVFYFLGSLCYLYLFLYQFIDHDYYFIAIFPFFFFLMLTFVESLRRFSVSYSRILITAFVIILFFNLKEAVLKCKENYSFRFDNRVFLANADFSPYYDIGPKLKELGLTKQDRIVSAFDDTYMCTLYFMNQPGTIIARDFERDSIQHILDLPVIKYLVLNDSAQFNKVYPNNFADKIVLVHRGLIVYKLK